MPFAYAGTRRRRNRDRRRTREEIEKNAAGESADKARADRRDEMPPGVGAQDLRDPDSRDPDAPPVENKS